MYLTKNRYSTFFGTNFFKETSNYQFCILYIYITKLYEYTYAFRMATSDRKTLINNMALVTQPTLHICSTGNLIYSREISIPE